MTEMEIKKMIDVRVKKLEKRFQERYALAFEAGGKNCFSYDEGEYFQVTGLGSFNAIVIEHADSEDEARKGRFEDGDLFYLAELDEDEMFNAMVKEIEG